MDLTATMFPQNAKNNTEAHFKFADKDHNGKLDQKEMSAMIGNMDKGTQF